jgi:non-ribosomal peptide synthetase component F
MLTTSLTAELKELSRARGATLFMTLMAAFKTLLYRQTGQEDLLVGTAIAGRNQSQTEGLIGFFINTLALRTDLAGSPKFTDLLAQVKKVALEAYAYQELPFDKLIEDLQPERSAGRAPIVQVSFGLQNALKSYLELPGLTLSELDFELEAGRYDLTLWMFEVDGQLRGVWTYLTELYDLNTIKRLTGRFVTLIESIVAQPEARLHTLEMLAETEKEKLSREKRELKNSNLKKFKNITPQAIRDSKTIEDNAACNIKR